MVFNNMPKRQLIIVDKVSQEFIAGEQHIQPLKNVSFGVEENSFNIIYGPSGSGKSTLLNILTGLQAPSKGTVHIEGHNIYELDHDALANFRASKLGFVYQTNYWIKSLTVLDNVAMQLYFSGLDRKKASKSAIDALSMVHMESYAKKLPDLLSGGEQQRVAIARALVSNPSFIIADEPTGNLDSKSGDMIMDLLRRCQVEFKRTVILVTHNMEYLPLADQLLHIEDGELQQMHEGSIQKTANALMDDMSKRIKRLSQTKHYAK